MVAAIWTAGLLVVFRGEGTPLAARISHVLLVWQGILFVLMVGTGVYSLATGWPFETVWLSLKIVLFGFIALCGVGIDRFFTPIIPAFGRLAQEGSSPELEQTIRQKLPPGFQRSEYLLEHGMLDIICVRKKLKETLVKILKWFYEK